MKRNLYAALALLALMIITSCQKNNENVINSFSRNSASLQPYPQQQNSFKDSVQTIVNKYIAEGIPGIQVTIKNCAETFVVNGGYSSLEKQTSMNPNETDWIFSITKTFTASLIMKEVERGRINLDSKIRRYLLKKDADSIAGSDVITVRNLLNHTSGLMDFTASDEFVEAQFAHPLHQPSLNKKMKLLYNQPLMFQPDTDFFYCNSNYLLLYVILQNVTGKTYELLLQKEIIQPLQLKYTYYDLAPNEIKPLQFPNYYCDPTSTGELLNATLWSIALGNTSLGYGGIAARATDVIAFYNNLIHGKVVSQNSFKKMTTWVQGKESTQPDYGLGIEYFQFAPGTTPQYGHEGDGVGCTTQIMYVPDTDTYLYINCTVGRKIPGPFLYKTTDFKNELCAFVAGWR